jgi:hypothetical protein
VIGAESNTPQPTVEIEEDVYRYQPANNGAGPLWCSGSTCLVRIGDDVFASGLETLAEIQPLNNCRWTLFRRGDQGWSLEHKDLRDRTREPCPLVGFPDGRLFLSANPTLSTNTSGGGPARPELLQFSSRRPQEAPARLLPKWEGNPRFTEHSYRSFAADAQARELILFQNIDYTHAEWTFRDVHGEWSAQGKLPWPMDRRNSKPEPIRVCYPNVALKHRAAYFCGVSDIIEPNREWRAFKRELTGKEWDYDFRRLFYAWTPDVSRTPFGNWVEIASRDETCGWISPGDLWVSPNGEVHLVWTERAIDERLRAKFFPHARQSHAMNYAVIRGDKIIKRHTIHLAQEGVSGEIASAPRFHETLSGALYLVYYVGGTDPAGKAVSENRLLRIQNDIPGPAFRIPLRTPFTAYFTTTVRAGSLPSDWLEMLGQRQGSPSVIGYARLRLQ